jgi:hypothetical protein
MGHDIEAHHGRTLCDWRRRPSFGSTDEERARVLWPLWCLGIHDDSGTPIPINRSHHRWSQVSGAPV